VTEQSEYKVEITLLSPVSLKSLSTVELASKHSIVCVPLLGIQVTLATMHKPHSVHILAPELSQAARGN
jgi:hypothetical protein